MTTTLNASNENRRNLERLKVCLKDTVETYGAYFPPTLRSRIKNARKALKGYVTYNEKTIEISRRCERAFWTENIRPNKEDLNHISYGSGSMALLIFKLDDDLADALALCDGTFDVLNPREF